MTAALGMIASAPARPGRPVAAPGKSTTSTSASDSSVTGSSRIAICRRAMLPTRRAAAATPARIAASSSAPTLSEIPGNDGTGLFGSFGLVSGIPPGAIRQTRTSQHGPNSPQPPHPPAPASLSTRVVRSMLESQPITSRLERIPWYEHGESRRSNHDAPARPDRTRRREHESRARAGNEGGARHLIDDAPPREYDAQLSDRMIALVEPRSAIDAQPVEDLLELLVVDVVGRVEVLGLGDELQGVVALQAILSRISSNGWRSWA